MRRPVLVNMEQLLAELAAGGVAVTTLLATPTALSTYDAAGGVVDLPAAALAIVDAHVAVDTAAAVRTGVLGVAQSAVGVQLLALTALQQRALLACLLYKAGALDPSLTVRPLGQWLS